MSASSTATRRGFIRLVIAAGTALVGRGPAQASGREFGTSRTADVMVRMRDGIHLATDIYRPMRDGEPVDTPLPVLLERTPYGKSVASRSEISVARPTAMSRAEVAEFFVAQGYVVVYQDCRGRYGSEGEFVKYLSDGLDGFDTCEWILNQPWCNGRIGTMGLSYAAHTQAALACAGAPGVRAMFLDSGGFANAYQDGIRQGGAFELKQATWAYRAALESPELAKDPERQKALRETDIRDWFGRMPWRRGHSPLSLAPDYESFLFDQWEHATFSSYWKQLGIYAAGFYAKFCDAPMVFMSSWYDPYPRSATDNYVGLSRRKRGPVRLILGPWTHGDRTLTYAGDVDFGTAAPVDGNLAKDFLTLRLQWFDCWLKKSANGVESAAPVTIFVMGGGSGRRNGAGRLDHGGRWRTERDWPLPNMRPTRYYLQQDGALATALPGSGATPFSYDFDPNHPVPSLGGTITSGEPVMRGGAFDQREGPRFFGSREPFLPLASRPDVLVFQTPVLTNDLELTGPVIAKLWISSNRADTDFTVKLIDVYPPNEDYPDGFAMNITDGILRARYRNSFETPAPLRPGEIALVTVEAFPTSNLFKRGHRIRIDISSSNFPHFDVNPNTGATEGGSEERVIARNTVFVDRQHASHVVFPVIPARS